MGAQTRISNKLIHQTFTLAMCNSPRQIFIFVANRIYRIWSNGPCFNHAFNSTRTHVIRLFVERHVKPSRDALLSKNNSRKIATSDQLADRRFPSLLEKRNLRFPAFGRKRKKENAIIKASYRWCSIRSRETPLQPVESRMSRSRTVESFVRRRKSMMDWRISD